MLRSWFFRVLIPASVVLIPLSETSAHDKGFFNSNGALTPFENTLTSLDAKEIVMLRPKIERELEEETKAEDIDDPKQAETEELSKLENKEDIVNAFGDPFEREPVRAQDNTSTSFQGMMAAMDAGHTELAFLYAMKQARYKKAVLENSKKAAILEALAMVRDGELTSDAWVMKDDYQEYHYLLDMSLDKGLEAEEQKEDEEDPEVQEQLRQEALKLMAEAEKELSEKKSKNDLFDDIPLELDEEEERVHARTLAKKVPVDPKGQVDVFFFFRERDQNAINMAPEIQQLFKDAKKDKNVNVIGFTLDVPNGARVQRFREKTKVDFNILPGQKLAAGLGITNSPTVLLVGKTNQTSYSVEKVENYYFLHEVLQMMKGK